MNALKLITFANISCVSAGDKVVYDNHVGEVVYDPTYNGNLKVAGRSLRNLVEECAEVWLMIIV